jgi:hypothetical protein
MRDEKYTSFQSEQVSVRFARGGEFVAVKQAPEFQGRQEREIVGKFFIGIVILSCGIIFALYLYAV